MGKGKQVSKSQPEAGKGGAGRAAPTGGKPGAGQSGGGPAAAKGSAQAGPNAQIAKGSSAAQTASKTSGSLAKGAESGAGKGTGAAARAIGQAILAKPLIALAAVALVGVVAVGALALSKPSLTGLWSISMQGTAVDHRGEGACGEHAQQEHEFEVTHNSSSFAATTKGGTLSGHISVNSVTFQILIIPVDGCNDTTELSGTLSGKTIRGSYSGGDCTGGKVCTWSGNFTAEIQQGK